MTEGVIRAALCLISTDASLALWLLVLISHGTMPKMAVATAAVWLLNSTFAL